MKAQENNLTKTQKFNTVYVIVRCVMGKGGCYMTANQVAYWNLQETKRSHQADETERNRSNVAREAENYRTNYANEQLKKYGIDVQKSRVDVQNQNETANTIFNGVKTGAGLVGGSLKSMLTLGLL